jgi:hypothetical protein
MSQSQLEDMISERWIPRQDWAVRVGAHHCAGDRAFSAVIAVADPNFNSGKRLNTGSQPRVATLVLESGQPLLLAVSAVPVADDLTDRAHRTSGRRDIAIDRPIETPSALRVRTAVTWDASSPPPNR